MSGTVASPTHYIGWDVGGWNCDKNGKSRDAIVILDASLAIVGKPWRGNLRKHINEADTTDAWIQALFTLCGANAAPSSQVYLGIDTPLGFSEAFVGLVTGLNNVEALESSATNPYLFRTTERHLFQQGLNPLSAIKDMIGSQATKGMHVLAKYAPKVQSCGAWTDGNRLTALEAYPAACKGSDTMHTLRSQFEPLGHDDKDDALICALIAYLFAENPQALAPPNGDVPASEGWIWVPRDSFGPVKLKT